MEEQGRHRLIETSQLRERPVFVSADGRRGTAVRWLGRAIAGALAAWLMIVVIGGCGGFAFPVLTPHASRTVSPGDGIASFYVTGLARRADGGSTPRRQVVKAELR
jgi:hypothetical protein